MLKPDLIFHEFYLKIFVISVIDIPYGKVLKPNYILEILLKTGK